MVSIDTVYQRVLAILNKENRGYLTPQEFNLMANQAQLEIFEQYFYDLNQFSRMGENDSEYANIIDNIEEKIDLFGQSVELEVIDNYTALLTNFSDSFLRFVPCALNPTILLRSRFWHSSQILQDISS